MNTQFLKTSQSEIYIPTPFAGIYHIASLVYTNAHDEDPLSDTVYNDLVSALQNTETLNSYYALEIINLTRLSNNQLLGTLIYKERPRSLYPEDHEHPKIIPKILDYILTRESLFLNDLGNYNISLYEESNGIAKTLTININFK